MEYIAIAISIISCLVCVLGYFRGGSKDAVSSAVTLGTLVEKVEQVQKSVDKIEKQSADSEKYNIKADELFKTLFNKTENLEERMTEVERKQRTE